jgi:hypothetical protein
LPGRQPAEALDRGEMREGQIHRDMNVLVKPQRKRREPDAPVQRHCEAPCEEYAEPRPLGRDSV